MDEKLKKVIDKIPSEVREKFLGGIKSCKSIDDVKDLAKKFNFSVTDGDAKTLLEKAKEIGKELISKVLGDNAGDAVKKITDLLGNK